MTASALKVLLPPMLPLCMFASSLISETTVVPLTLAGGFGGVCWYLQGRFTRIETILERLEQDAAASRKHHSTLCPLCVENNHNQKESE